MKKSVIAIAVSMCLIFTLCATVYAKTDSDSGVLTGGYQCSAYLNVHDSSYSAYAVWKSWRSHSDFCYSIK